MKPLFKTLFTDVIRRRLPGTQQPCGWWTQILWH